MGSIRSHKTDISVPGRHWIYFGQEHVKKDRFMKAKVARRWLGRNGWGIAKLNAGHFLGKAFVRRYRTCLSAVLVDQTE